jgi:NitT/TauT family transport system substrate-binding protein
VIPLKGKIKIYFSLLLSLIIIIASFSGCSKSSDSKLTKVKLNEVVRSVFYAPMYAAINQGFFKEEGLDIDLSTGQGADKTAQEVLSGNADIGFCGPEQVIYIYNQKRDNYPVLFAQLTQTDGSFLVGRKGEDNFDWSSLKGKTIIGGRPGGVPEMALEYVLKSKGLINEQNINLVTNIAFTATAGAFKGGTGDYVALFEPTASMLVQDKAGSIVASIGKSIGTLPYTCFFSTKSYLDKHKDIVEKFTRAIYKGQQWTAKNNDEAVANAIKSFFPGTDQSILIQTTKNYREINAFASTPLIKEEDMIRLMDIIQSYQSSLIKERPAFKSIVNTEIAKKITK